MTAWSSNSKQPEFKPRVVLYLPNCLETSGVAVKGREVIWMTPFKEKFVFIEVVVTFLKSETFCDANFSGTGVRQSINFLTTTVTSFEVKTAKMAKPKKKATWEISSFVNGFSTSESWVELEKSCSEEAEKMKIHANVYSLLVINATQ